MKLSKTLIAFLCFPLLLMNTQCDEDDDFQVSNCGQPVIIDNAYFESAVSSEYTLVDFNLNGDCLTIEVSSSGCDGETWSMVVVDSGNIAESSPEQRYLKFVFTNDEACLAVFNQSREFNLTGLRIDGSNEVVLNIEGLPEVINYMYP
ncbi:hypothetical protein [Psychroserpens sp.]|uniref:hypothetical protein n=1 Tax=Psychroserpens sp. TaxID=2020870 RepID=UPI002B270CB6|nr:hypothetical protein [Psychroserpens sp.]